MKQLDIFGGQEEGISGQIRPARTINECIAELYREDVHPEIAADIDGETGEISHRIETMIAKLDAVL